MRLFLFAFILTASQAALAQDAADKNQDRAAAPMPLRERPLFSPSRRGAAKPEEALPEPTTPEPLDLAAPNWQLVGVVISQAGGSAVFKTDAGETVRLSTGETHDGWTLARVQRFKVWVVNGAKQAEMKLSTAAAPGTPAAATPPPVEEMPPALGDGIPPGSPDGMAGIEGGAPPQPPDGALQP